MTEYSKEGQPLVSPTLGFHESMNGCIAVMTECLMYKGLDMEGMIDFHENRPEKILSVLRSLAADPHPS